MFKLYRPWLAAVAGTALLASLTGPPVSAETIVVGDQVTVRQTEVPHPKRGMSMVQVQQHFGEPRERHPTVGTPPITRWDYDNFAVFFEKDLVIDAVVPGASSPANPADPSITPSSAPEAAPIPATAPTAAPPAVQAGAQPSAAAPATGPAPTPATVDAQKAGSTPKGDGPLSNVSLHH
ncbi:MAG TPA: hypothetical protein VHY19_05835 [Steroidobacteraceae bacterium]|jgi:hypothetical protein|nr:hypothetical protein [Steroidobacteraceae bacterium]